MKKFASRALGEPPPPILPATTTDFWKLGKTGLGLRRLGRDDMLELMRVPPMCVADWVNEHFEDDQVVAEWIASRAVLGEFAGPWSAGTAANLILENVLRAGRPSGGGPALVAALESQCRAAGVTLQTDAAVRRIEFGDDGAVSGVELDDGTAIEASTVLATCDPRTTFLELVEPARLPADVERQFLNVRARGTTAVLMLGLNAPLQIDGVDAGAERIFLGGGSLDGLERAFDAVKYGEFSERPVVDIRTGGDGDKQVVTCFASYAPYALRAGWSDDTREKLQANILARLSEVAPTIRDRIATSKLWCPPDIERELGINAGACTTSSTRSISSSSCDPPPPAPGTRRRYPGYSWAVQVRTQVAT